MALLPPDCLTTWPKGRPCAARPLASAGVTPVDDNELRVRLGAVEDDKLPVRAPCLLAVSQYAVVRGSQPAARGLQFLHVRSDLGVNEQPPQGHSAEKHRVETTVDALLVVLRVFISLATALRKVNAPAVHGPPVRTGQVQKEVVFADVIHGGWLGTMEKVELVVSVFEFVQTQSLRRQSGDALIVSGQFSPDDTLPADVIVPELCVFVPQDLHHLELLHGHAPAPSAVTCKDVTPSDVHEGLNRTPDARIDLGQLWRP
mmetsp:Transcript_81966/g.244462  ORF Transcript_81966/g.244462 Transcript_81966/m.244462 type:complete len:259 (+) Transcript_81966:2-778(+)